MPAAVRPFACSLPKEYRFAGSEIAIKHFGNGVLLLPVDEIRKLSPAVTLHSKRLAYDLVSTVAYTPYDRSLALNMGKVKDFRAVTLDTFAAFLTRIGVLDRVRDEVMESVRLAGRKVLESWAAEFAAAGLPDHLVRRVEEHPLNLPLQTELAAGGS